MSAPTSDLTPLFRARAAAGVLAAALVTLLASGCARDEPLAEPGALVSTPLAGFAGAARGGPTRFERLPPERTGIAFENRFEWGHPLEHLYPHGWAGGGVCAGDYDGDGLADLYFTSQTGADRLYRQVGALAFEDATEAAGLSLEPAWGAGASFADVDGDGDLDLYVCNYDAPNRLWRNRGDGTFEELGAAAGVAYSGASVMGAFADHDGDGDLDLYLLTNRLYPGGGADSPRTSHAPDGSVVVEPGFEARFAIQERTIGGRTEKYVVKAGERDRLFANDGHGRFTDVSDAAGIGGNHPGLSATWWDYDEDGRPDLYVCNDFWDPDRLYHNEGDGSFRDVLAEAVPHTPWFAMGADFCDVDLDGHVDLLAADMSATTHYMSKIMMGDMNESRWFLESAEPRQYMRNALYLGTGTGGTGTGGTGTGGTGTERFMEAAFLAGVASTDWTWSVKFGDLDADGRPDLFATNGTANHSFDPDLTARLRAAEERLGRAGADAAAVYAAQWALYREVPPRRERNVALRNRATLDFEDVGAAWGLDHESLSFGAVLCDLDRDGDLDVVASNVDDPVSIHENAGGGHALLVRLVGRSSNRFGIGATVEVQTPAGVQTDQNFPTSGYMSADEPLLFFGLGDAPRATRLTVRWPSGHEQSFADLAAGHLHTITEPGGAPPAPRTADVPVPRFTETALALGLDTGVLAEKSYDDFAHEPLLPARLSRTGPGLAFGDADGDGDDDLWVGGPRGTSGQLFTNLGGRFVRQAGGPWEDDAGCEDTAALWIDADSDGDLDLLVGSGSNEWRAGSPFLRDRLYTNEGDWRFTRAPFTCLPDAGESTGALVAADFDQDGDLDVFAGARSIPRGYPLAPVSRLLVNEDGTFVDRTEELAPGLERVGLVTGALWSDADGDGDRDLLVALEWGPVAYWQNEGSRLVDRTREAGLAERTGWWNGIASADLDGDGDFDYVATNAGWNTKYHASAEEPALLLYGSFDGGPPQLLEAKSGLDCLLPVRGLSCSSDAMPFIAERTPTFHDFASARLEEIYAPERLAAAREFRATELASCVLWNEGPASGEDEGATASVPRLRFEPLPRVAQVSPGYGVQCGDFTGDGHPDVYLVQNSFAREPETGHWDGGLSQLLVGDGAGGLVPEPPRASGLVVPGDATALAVGDLDGDGRPDFVVGQNGDRVLAFGQTRRAPGLELGKGRSFAVRLTGPPGNPACVGARVTFNAPDVPSQTVEIHAGSGHLVQSAPLIFFGTGGRRGEATFEVRWPDGRVSRHTGTSDAFRVGLVQPER